MRQPTPLGRALASLSRIEPLRAPDAYSCIGGGTEGYRRAFKNRHITGVDIQAQPDYRGDAFHQGDAVEYIRAHGHELDFIHASPPCQGEGTPTQGHERRPQRCDRPHLPPTHPPHPWKRRAART